jgi:hypothetical protein
MKLTTKQSSLVPGKIMIAFALTSLLGGAFITPALARDDRGHQDRGWHKGDQRHHHRYDRNDDRGRRDRYYYSSPVYAPAPVYYPPEPSPGISIFFPLEFRR